VFRRPARFLAAMEIAATRIEQQQVNRMLLLLRSPRFVLAILAFAAAYCAAAAWLPWSLPGGAPPPPWAAALGLEHPFSAWPFLACVALLFASTLACTWGRRARIRAIAAGELPPSAIGLPPRGANARSFLEARGFRGRGEVLRRFGWALWGGWVLHVGLLVLIAAVLVQQAFHDTAAFDLTEGEAARLSGPGAVFGRESGPLAPSHPPDLEVTLLAFDPFLHQEGYAPDRQSRLAIAPVGRPPRLEKLDRAAGARIGMVEVFQAIPTGLSVIVEVPGMGTRSIRLETESEHVASARLDDPAGRPARFVVTTERPLNDRLGTGRLWVEYEQAGSRHPVERDAPFVFGRREARVISVGRWGRFTYARSPGMIGVLAGFALVIAGCALLAFPAGVARLGPPGSDPAARVFQVRGRDLLLAEWQEKGMER
jgi:hypothetical protein